MQKPQRERVYLSKLDKELVLNFITLADDKDIYDRWGDEANALFLSVHIDMVLWLFWQLMDSESKKLISLVVIEDWTDSLDAKVLEFTSPIEKLKRIISGQRELFVIWTAILNTRKKSDPEIDENAVKKKTVESP
jgi:hypothetical protein